MDAFLGEIRMMTFNFAPKSWAACDGQTLGIAQNAALFALLGTTFGGDGRQTFKLPDFRGRTGVHVGPKHVLGQSEGVASVQLTALETPLHAHSVGASARVGTVPSPTNNVFGKVAATAPIYGPATNLTPLNAVEISIGGGGQPHTNMQPYVPVNFCICLAGIFPSRT